MGLLSDADGVCSVFGIGTVFAFIIHFGKDSIFATIFTNFSIRICGRTFNSSKVIPSIPGAEFDFDL